MAQSKRFRGFTIPELVITVAIVSLLMTYAWDFYFSGREITRHGVSQSAMQNDTRIFFDHLSKEIASCYRFKDILSGNPDVKKFSFYSFQLARTGLDRIYYNELTAESVVPRDQKFVVLRVEYEWNKATGKIIRRQAPGYIYFQRNPMEFSEGPAAEFTNSPNAPYEKEVLKNIADFDLKAYELKYKSNFGDNEVPFTTREIPDGAVNNASSASFIVLRVHNKIDEVSKRKDEELDLVGKFYSRERLMDSAYKGYFSSVDELEAY